MCMRILKRKNRRRGSGTLKRICCCKVTTGVSNLCLVHTLWPFLQRFAACAKPWGHLDGGKANKHLQVALGHLRVVDAHLYHTHDLRRGHAEASTASPRVDPESSATHGVLQDMRARGDSLLTILKAGQWSSRAFAEYLDQAGLEKELVFATAIDEPLD